jgi:hypothetical protein
MRIGMQQRCADNLINQTATFMDYTITINPENWNVFLTTSPYKFAFRETMYSELRKIKIGDRFVVYIAQEMHWGGIFTVTKESYKSSEPVYPNDPAFCIVVEVAELFLPKPECYISITEPELWNNLNRFSGVNRKKSGWIYGAKLARSLSKISTSDTEKILEFFDKHSGVPKNF